MLAAWTLALLTALADEPEPVEVRAQIDWQGHPAMHIPWWMFGEGLTDRELRHRRWRHRFRQTVTAPTLGDSGVRLFLAAAVAAERAKNPTQARRLILEQFAFIEAFAEANPDGYVVARTPAEAREALATTDKLVFVHSIEGMHHLLWDETDASFWARQGVALVTLIHLRDDELGGAAINEGPLGPLVNPKGARKRRRDEPRGLTELGRASIVRLDRAGILVDYTHASPESFEDALAVCAEHGIPPIHTHGALASERPGERAITGDQLVRMYQLGGMFSVGLNARLLPGSSRDEARAGGVCPGTVEAWAAHHALVQDTLRRRAPDITGDPTATALTDAWRTRLSTGWSSDWNGWTSHSWPVTRCRRPNDPTELDRKGLAHPGLLPEHWDAVEARGVDLDPMLRSAERFLQLWEQVRGE